MRPDEDFETLATYPDPPVEELALALAAELREPDRDATLGRLDELGEQLIALVDAGGGPEMEAWACAELLGGRHGLAGDRDDYDNPDNSMLDLVLERRRGLPIALSVVYVAAARRAGIPLAGVGLPGHFVVAHFGASPPLVLDPFGGGTRVEVQAPPRLVRPWTPHETALRMLNNLIAAYTRRARIGDAIVAARLRLALPLPDAERERVAQELVSLEARLN
jgi:regulator of sirC expression with transglutaminase-like and TPR domain